ncbi:MAG TPA: PEP/pyruvate-binding domain-containing protein, partial [Chloroflexota bacterium]|nr:PEP/pyruvate-binding domain-containing protein [Chloroflexota bacterium]
MIQWLDAPAPAPSSSESRRQLGSKAHTLTRLLSAGLPVPPGFVLTADAFPAKDAASPDALPGWLRQALSDAYGELGRRLGASDPANPVEPAVAIRSSGTAEDLAEASFAGQYETFLGVRGAEEVVRYAVRCHASLTSERAASYRQRAQAAGGSGPAKLASLPTPRMAVLVQALVNADAAGIAFTADPITGDDSRILIDAAWGLGASVADGDVEPDHWEMDRQTHAIVTQLTGHKPTRCGPTPESPRESVLPEQQDAPCLTALQAAEVAALALRAEETIGGPADVEWALQGDTLWLLQARPITTGVASEADVPGITTAAGRPIPDGKDASQRDESAAEPLKPVGPSPAFPFVWADPMDASTHWVQRAMDGRAPEAMPPLELDIRARFARSLGNARQIAGWRNAAERLMELNGWQYWTHDRPPTPAGVPAPDPFQHARETFTWLGEQLTERGENYRDAVVFPEMHARNK